MALDPVRLWGQVVAAWNAKDWELAKQLTADDFQQVAIVSGVIGEPAGRFDRSTQHTVMDKLGKKGGGLTFINLSVAALGTAVAVTYREVRADGVSWEGCALAKFNDEGLLAELYTAVPDGG